VTSPKGSQAGYRWSASRPTVVAIAMRPHEIELVRRAVELLVEHEGDSWTAANVLQMLRAPVSVDEELLAPG
jgi:hypothetical protein